MQLFTWAQFERAFSGRTEQSPLFAEGSAVTIGSFDGPHIGHDVLFNAVLDASKSYGYASGVITFTRALGGFKRPADYEGDLSTLEQRLAVFRSRGFDFAAVIDFSTDFGRIEGQDFFHILKKSCGLSFLAEGRDFRCGYRGAFGMKEIAEFSAQNGITAQFPEPVRYRDDRVSSSLIRSCILHRDFSSASVMLGRNYVLDCSRTEWSREGNTAVAGTEDFIQILPPAGSYDVVAITPGSRIRTRLTAEPHFLRLEVPNENTLPCIRGVEFISGN
jgi:riboflavin kinase/FMN adenylyltransferase